MVGGSAGDSLTKRSSGLTITWNGTGVRSCSSRVTWSSMTARRSDSPIWGAARPTPGASRMVSRISSISDCTGALRTSAGVSERAFWRRTGVPAWTIFSNMRAAWHESRQSELLASSASTRVAVTVGARVQSDRRVQRRDGDRCGARDRVSLATALRGRRPERTGRAERQAAVRERQIQPARSGLRRDGREAHADIGAVEVAPTLGSRVGRAGVAGPGRGRDVQVLAGGRDHLEVNVRAVGAAVAAAARGGRAGQQGEQEESQGTKITTKIAESQPHSPDLRRWAWAVKTADAQSMVVHGIFGLDERAKDVCRGLGRAWRPARRWPRSVAEV